MKKLHDKTIKMDVKNLEKITVAFYNMIADEKIDSSQEIPCDVFQSLSCMKVEHMVFPLVGFELRKGRSREAIANKYRITVGKVRYIGGLFGYYKKQ